MHDALLLIEDDERLSAMVAEYLARAGYRVTPAGSVAEGLRSLRRQSFAALLLDLTLPDGDGLDFCRRLRSGEAGSQAAAMPVLMLTARGDAMDRVIGLEIGADDYLGKPFEPRELLARLRAILRRRTMPATAALGVLRFGALEIDRDQRTVTVDGEPRVLTGYQFDLLLALAENAGRVMTRELLLERLKGESLEAFDRSIDVHVSRLRAAIEADPKQPRHILTLRGVGYLFTRGGDS
jgi:DNA-binding response OmpR family regulator